MSEKGLKVIKYDVETFLNQVSVEYDNGEVRWIATGAPEINRKIQMDIDMSTISTFYAMWGIHLTEETLDEIETLWGSDEPIDAVNELERLAKEYGLELVPTQPMDNSSCVIGVIFFESDGWDELAGELRTLDIPERDKHRNMMLLILDLPIQISPNYHVFVQIG